MLQRALHDAADSGATPHARWGDGRVNEEQIPAGDRPIIIEVMEFNLDSALAKVDQVAAIVNNAGRATQARIAIAIAFNRRARDEHVRDDSQLTDGWTRADNADLTNGVTQIVTRMQQLGIVGACFPVVWSSTMKGGGYTFPFLEMRARTTLHKATRRLVDLYRDEGEPIVRGMDADVSDDPLLLDRAAGMNALDKVWDVDGGTHVVSGGYDWDTRAKPATFWGESVAPGAVARWNGKWTQILTLINTHEHRYRRALLQGGASLLYWPEPNVYMTATTRQAGAEAALKAVKPGVQMKESIFYLKKHAAERKLAGTYDHRLRTVKPAKDAYSGACVSSSSIRMPVSPVWRTSKRRWNRSGRPT